jgi:TRAP-type C4-dicarboxylate transport system substrate-binding protein
MTPLPKENPVSVVMQAKRHEVRTSPTLDERTYGVDFTLINEPCYQPLTKETRQTKPPAGSDEAEADLAT